MEKERYFQILDRIYELLSNDSCSGNIDENVCRDQCYGQCCDNSIALLSSWEEEYCTNRFKCEHLDFSIGKGLSVRCIHTEQSTQKNCTDKPLICVLYPYFPHFVGFHLELSKLHLTNLGDHPFCNLMGEPPKEVGALVEELFSDTDQRIHFIQSQMADYVQEGLFKLAGDWWVSEDQMKVVLQWLNTMGMGLDVDAVLGEVFESEDN